VSVFFNFYARQHCNASRILAIVEVSVRPFVCPSVRHALDLYQNCAS